MVPLLAVSFALLTRFPAFRGLHEALQAHLLQGMLPAEIARTVLRYLGRFAANASGLTLVGFLFVAVTALVLLLTVENALNRMWQVKKDRPLVKRLGLFVVVLALGPIVLGATFWGTASLLKASAGLLRGLSPTAAFVVSLWPAMIGAMVLAACYYFIPNTRVRKRDAIAGALLAATALELGKRGFAAYLATVPTYRVMYGAFAALPVFLLWVYLSWLVVLAGALVAANLPRGSQPGRRKARA